MNTLIIQALVFLVYVGWVYLHFGVLTSISESYYHIKEKGLFTVFCFALGFPMFTYARAFHEAQALPGDYTWLFYLSMFLCFTGAAADYKRTMTDTIHFAGAAISIVAALAGLWLQYGLWYLGAAWVLVSLLCLRSYNRIWWIEIAAFAAVLTGGLILSL